MKKLTITVLSLLSLCSGFASERLLDGKWLFRTDPLNDGQRQSWHTSDCMRNGWDRMEVPGCWNTRIEYANYTGTAWYATTFTIDEQTDGKEIRLNFEAVYTDATIYLNGHLLGSHDFGFTSFGFNITDKVTPGRENQLVVRVDNSFKLGATWNWGGIRRPVRLSVLPKDRITDLFVTATPDLHRGTAQIGIKVCTTGGRQARLKLQITDPKGQVVATASTLTDGHPQTLIPITLRKASLWDFDHPQLYTATVTYDDQPGISERFGIRTIQVDGYKLLLNGKSIRLNGANYVPYDPFHGSTLPSQIYRRDIDRMKSCGVNMARLSHLALPEDVLDYLDEKGMLIFEEIPLWNRNHHVTANAPIPMRWLTELITQRYNHPCIIGWSAGNEIGRMSDNPDLKGYLTSAFRHIKSLDSTRLSVYVTHTAAKQYDEPVLLSDMILYNQYGAHGERADEVNRRYPGKPIFYSEYGTKANSEDPNNTSTDYAALMESMRGREHLIGASVWTFNDYRTNYRDSGTAATGNRPWGVVDVYGTLKRGFQELQRQNSPLQALTLEVSDEKAGQRHLTTTLTPRQPLDLPSYEMSGYKLRLRILNQAGIPLQQHERPLPTLKPGSEALTIHADLPTAAASKILAELISPTGYAIHTIQRSLHAPQAPIVTSVESNQDAIRIRFERDATADEWYVEYGLDSLNLKSKPTIDGVLELRNMEFGKTYRMRLMAMNDAGQTPATEIVSATTRAAELPPIVRHLKQEGSMIQIGYDCDLGDFCYEFEYGTAPDKLDRRMLTTVTGACNLPVDNPAAQHYLRLRKRLRYGYESDWSRVYKIEKSNL